MLSSVVDGLVNGNIFAMIKHEIYSFQFNYVDIVYASTYIA